MSSMLNNLKPISERHVKALILKDLVDLLENDDPGSIEFTFVQHLVHILRRKGEGNKEPYGWSNNDFLIRLQEYKQELENP
jgi:hypothetical protein